MKSIARKPAWLRVRLPNGEGQEQLVELRKKLRGRDLHTVCEEARCPNLFECWSHGTATVMILGEVCTRSCRFCSVRSGDPDGRLDPSEPENTGRALAGMGLAYVVVTMVDRDDLPDGGVAHVAETVRRIKHHSPELRVETLVGDFGGSSEHLTHLVQQGAPDVFAHNVEVVPRLQRRIRDARSSWDRSISALRIAREAGAEFTKSSLMVGIGETEAETLEAMEALRDAQVDVLTIGQYLRPTPRHVPVERWVEPAEFDRYRDAGLEMGFAFVASGPLVRSSYRAAEAFLEGALKSATSPTQDVDRYGRKRLRVVR